MRAQHALQLAQRALGRQPFGHGLAQRDGRRETHDGGAAIEQYREQAAEAADQRPVFRKQHRKPAALLVRRTADEDRHRHQMHVQVGAHAVRLQQLGQRIGMRLAAALFGNQRIAAAPPRQRQVGALALQRVARQRHQRRRQAGLAAGLVQDQGIREAVILEHIHHRLAVVVAPGLFGFDGQAQPRVGQPAEQARPPRAFGHACRGEHWRGGRRCVQRHGRGRRQRSGRRAGLGAGRAGRGGLAVRERQGILFWHRRHYRPPGPLPVLAGGAGVAAGVSGAAAAAGGDAAGTARNTACTSSWVCC